jgi:hypothetical protein
MTQPRFASVNVVVADVGACATFLAALGVDLEPTRPEWESHHRTFAADAPQFDADLDSPAFARWWGGVPDECVPGVVVNLRVDEHDDVDRLHRRAIELGASELKAPWDAFWGARHSVVLAPGPVCVAFTSEPDAARRSPPPATADFA